jgi:hypothetical protein
MRLNDSLWAYRNALKNPMGTTSYKIIYGKACPLPLDLEHSAFWTIKKLNYDFKVAREKILKQFKQGDKVLLFNTRLKFFAGKLRSKWEGPYDVEEAYTSGAVKLKG